MRQYIVWSPRKLEEGCGGVPCKHFFLLFFFTITRLLFILVLFILSFHDLRDSDASCSHLPAVKSDRGFDIECVQRGPALAASNH